MEVMAQDQPRQAAKWRRHFLGACSLLLLTIAIVLMAQGTGAGSESAVAGGCMRIGLLTGAIWLAWPQAAELTTRVPAWLLIAILIGFVLVVARPKQMAPLVIPLVLALTALHWAGRFLGPKK